MPPRRRREPKGSWVVRVRQTVIKELFCEGCTEQEARDDPFEHSTASKIKMNEDFEVLDVEPGDE